MKAIVIGSGIAGLAVAIRLQLKGFETTIYESNSYPGGKLTAFQLGEYRFDAGPSLFTMPQYFEDLFTLAGKSFSDYCPYKKLDIITRYFYPDGKRVNAYSDVNLFAEELHKNFSTSKKAVLAHLQHSNDLFDLTNNVFLQKSLHKPRQQSAKDLAKAGRYFYKLKLFTKMHNLNAKRFDSPEVVQLFDRFATYNGSNPYEAPATLNVIPHLEHNIGAFFPINGMHNVTESLVQLAKEVGVSFRFKSKIDEIIIENNKAVGIKTAEKQIIKSEIVISNVDIVPTYKKLLKNINPPKKILEQERSSSALIFYWGINKSFKEISLHNIFFSKDYKNEFEYIFGKKGVCDDPTIYINCSNKISNNDAPTNKENWFVMINVPNNQGQNWEEIISASRKNILEKLSKQLNCNIEDLIEEEEVLDPLSIESKTNSYRGALYGSSSNNRMAAFLRHPNFHKSIKGLYFCGGSVHPGGGIPLCMLSAKIVDELIENAPTKKDHSFEQS